jgi:hypothetical protein
VFSIKTAAASINFSPLVPQFASKGYATAAVVLVRDAGGTRISCTVDENAEIEPLVQPLG